MAWIVLILSGMLEAGWALSLKASDGFTRLWPSVLFVVLLVASMGGLAWALKTLPVGVAYGVWVGIGAALTADPHTTPDTLLAHADSAMYRAKRRERGGFEFFDPDTYAEDHSRAVARDQVAGALRTALRQGQLELHYQPIYDVDGGADTPAGALYGVEALARWRHPERAHPRSPRRACGPCDRLPCRHRARRAAPRRCADGGDRSPSSSRTPCTG